jgi:hypothetical protein
VVTRLTRVSRKSKFLLVMPPPSSRFTLKSSLKRPPTIGSKPRPQRSWFQVDSLQIFKSEGLPGKWAPPTFPSRIPQDHGLRYVDQNAARRPACPLEPLFRSIFAVTPTFDPKPFQLVTDRNNLRKLAWVVIGEAIDNFRIDIELVRKTMLFTRWEKASTEIVSEFRHEFEKHFTRMSKDLRGITALSNIH